MKLKILTVFLSVIMLISCIPFSASAFMFWEEDTANLFECGDYTYELMSDGNAKIVSHFTYDEEATKLTIPSELDGYTVTTIGESAFEYNSYKSITIPDTVTYIDVYAFSSSFELEKINIPASVETIVGCTFSGSTSLRTITVDEANEHYASENGILYTKDMTTLVEYPAGKQTRSTTIPETVTAIGIGAFYGHDSLKSVTFHDNITVIDSYAFQNCSKLDDVVLPQKLEYIGDYAFSCCEQLDKITIPDSVTSIGGGAFDCCTSIDSIVIPNNVLIIGEYAFNGCSDLETVHIGKDVVDIGVGAFAGCSYLSSITVDADNATYLANDGILFNKEETELIVYPAGKENTSYTIPDGVEIISYSAFDSAYNLESISMPDSVTQICDSAFSYCDFESINLSNSLEQIGAYAFGGCSLKSITLPNSLTYIGELAFSECGELKQIAVPNSVKYIGDGAFSYCSELKNITLGNGISAINGYTFVACEKLTTINIPKNVTKIYDYAFGECINLKNITIEGSLTHVGADIIGSTEYFYDESNWENGILYLGNAVISAKYEQLNEDTYEYETVLEAEGYCVIKDGTTVIADAAFASCYNLLGIKLPESLINIGNYAFSDCTELNVITVPENVTYIGEQAFGYCYNDFSDIEDFFTDIPEDYELFIPLEGFVVRCVENSAAHTYAIDNELDYIFIGDVEPGDVNNDGKVNGKDVLMLRKYIVGLESTIDNSSADCNFDGKINGKDVLLLRKYIVGLVEFLG